MSNWLVISYFANIDAMAPSHHLDDRLPYFRQKGIAVRLLSSPCGARYTNLPHTRIFSFAPSGIRYEVRYLLRRRTRKKFWFKFWETLFLLPIYPLYFLEKAILRLDSTWSWFMTGTCAALIEALRHKPKVIYSTGGPVSAHIAAMMTSSILKVPHIAEFQDPLVHQYAAPGKFERYFIRKIERLVLSKAAASVFLTRRAALNAAQRHPSCRNIFSLYAGAVPGKNSSGYVQTEMMTISHFGSLDGSRNLHHFFSALEKVLREDHTRVSSVRLNIYGNNGRRVRQQIDVFPYREAIIVHGKVPRKNAVKAMHSADLLLLIQNTDDVSFETIPSKVYEYLHTGRPILALLYRNDELREMLEVRGHTTVQADDEEALTGALRKHIDLWKQGGGRTIQGESPFTVERAVDQLISLAKDAVKRYN